MANNAYQILLAQSFADSTAVGNTTTETIIIPDLQPTAGYFTQGKRLRCTLYGVVSNVVTAVPTITFRVRIGTTTLSATYATSSTALACNATANTNLSWRGEFELVCQTTGTAGTGLVMGQFWLPNLTANNTIAGVGYPALLPPATPAPGTINTTVSNFISTSAQWSAANASNTITVKSFLWEELN